MTNPTEIADRYLATWNASPNERRVALDAWAPDASYVDPLMKGSGRDGIRAMINGAVAQFPGHRFTLSGSPGGHGDHVRFSWSLAAEGSAPVAHGTDIVRLDGQGRIAEVVGFLDVPVA